MTRISRRLTEKLYFNGWHGFRSTQQYRVKAFSAILAPKCYLYSSSKSIQQESVHSPIVQLQDQTIEFSEPLSSIQWDHIWFDGLRSDLLKRVGIETFWLHLHTCSSHVLRSTDHNMLPRHSWSPRLLLPPRPSSLSFPLSLCLNAITCSESEQLASLKHALRLTQSPQAPIITSALRSLALMN